MDRLLLLSVLFARRKTQYEGLCLDGEEEWMGEGKVMKITFSDVCHLGKIATNESEEPKEKGPN